MFDARRRRLQAYAAKRPWQYSIQSALSMGLLGVVVFHNVWVGLAGGLITGVGAYLWWRPGGPGPRLAANRGETQPEDFSER